jgi:membrane-associated phospholipid phosphatase
MIKHKIVLIIAFSLFNTSFSQNKFFIVKDFKSSSGSINYLKPFQEDVNSFYNTGIKILESPFHFDSEDVILTGAILSATVVSFSLDHPVRNGVKDLHNAQLDRFTRLGEKFGSPRYSLALGGALYLTGYFSGSREVRKTGLMLVEGIFMNGLITEGLKIIIGRSRPHNNEGNYDIDFLQMESDNDDHSLPSGHTSTVFTVATILSDRIDNIFATIALYSAAGFTAFQRIYNDDHWISDTILGAALGTVIGLKVIKLNSENVNGSSDPGMTLLPLVSPNRYGVNLSLNF